LISSGFNFLFRGQWRSKGAGGLGAAHSGGGILLIKMLKKLVPTFFQFVCLHTLNLYLSTQTEKSCN